MAEANRGNVSRSVFIIYDKVAENFIGQPVLDRHAAPVIRLFHQLLGDQSTQLAAHPRDYSVLHVGYIEDNGQLWPIEPVTVATGESWAASQEKSANA